MRDIKYAISNFEIVIIVDGNVKTVGLSHPMYLEICRALQNGDKEKAVDLIDVKEHVEKIYAEKGVEVKVTETKSGEIEMQIEGHKVEGEIAKLMTTFKQAKLPLNAIVKFWKKFMANAKLGGEADYTRRQDLLRFINNVGLFLLPNGNFLAFKGVNSYGEGGNGRQFRSQYDHSFIYELDKVVVEPNAKKITDVHVACGVGLHAGSVGFAKSYGHFRLLVEIDPADVVTIPRNGDNHLRAWRLIPRAINPSDTNPTSNFIRLGDRPAIVKTEDVEVSAGETEQMHVEVTEGKLEEVKGVVVRLMNYGPNKIGVIKVVREKTGSSLAEAKAFVEACPKDFPAVTSIMEATKIVAELTKVGATAVVVGGRVKDTNTTAASKKRVRDRSNEKKKVRWYRLVGGKLQCQRKIVSPGEGWSSDKAAVLAAVKPDAKGKKATPRVAVLKGAGVKRTYYRVQADGTTVDTVRAEKRPPGYTGERPKWFTKK